MVIRYDQNLKQRARELRNKSTPSEILLWQQLKGNKLGIKFLRQKIIYHYIVDFYCPYLKLAIEIDGSSHDDKINEDIFRQGELESLGVVFLRFSDVDVLNNLDLVIKKIKELVTKLK
ncbi:MAG: DUF559 domain-containing protein [Patescibacteria group bacterium]